MDVHTTKNSSGTGIKPSTSTSYTKEIYPSFISTWTGFDESSDDVDSENDEEETEIDARSCTKDVYNSSSGSRGFNRRIKRVLTPPRYSIWCEDNADFVEPFYNLIVTPFLNNLKDNDNFEPTLTDFYKFAYHNSTR